MIYYVEDDDSIRELVVYTLRQVGLEAQGFETPADLEAAMQSQKPDLILLDVMLPGEDGFSILRRLRTDDATRELPVIMVTAKDSEYDKVHGLDLGADDYIAKPFGMAEMVARVRARLRRICRERDMLVSGALAIDLQGHIVTANSREVSLTLKEYELLKLLMEHPGTAFSRETLLSRVWDYGFDGGSRTVDVHVQTLRAKLGDCGDMIETVRGVGYRFGGRDA